MGLRVLRAFAQEAAEERSFERLNARYVGANERLIRWQSAFHPSIQLLVGLGFAAVIGYGGILILDGALSVGQFVTFSEVCGSPAGFSDSCPAGSVCIAQDGALTAGWATCSAPQ